MTRQPERAGETRLQVRAHLPLQRVDLAGLGFHEKNIDRARRYPDRLMQDSLELGELHLRGMGQRFVERWSDGEGKLWCPVFSPMSRQGDQISGPGSQTSELDGAQKKCGFSIDGDLAAFFVVETKKVALGRDSPDVGVELPTL